MEPPHAAVTDPRVSMEVQALQLGHGPYQPGRKCHQIIVWQVEVPQSWDMKMAFHSEGGEGVWVQLLKLVALQLQQPERSEALEGVWMDVLQLVVIQV